MVQYLRVKGGLNVGGGDVFVVGVWVVWIWCVEEEFSNTLSPPLDKAVLDGIDNRNACNKRASNPLWGGFEQ